MAATIRDVAKAANVSVATVSRVLNHDSRVSQKTVLCVQEAIKLCNYVPNSFARSLKGNSSKTIGFLVSNIGNSYFINIAKVIEDILLKYDYNLIICSTNDDPKQELSRLDHLKGMQIEGLIINTTSFNDSKIIEMSKTLPVVLLERTIADSSFCGDYVGSNNVASVSMLAKHLLSQGHRKIALVNGNPLVSTSRERYTGFISAMNDAGITIDAGYPYVCECDSFSSDDGFVACRKLLNQSEPPTAIIAANNTLAIGVLRYLALNHISVPKDLSFMCYGNIDNSDLFLSDISCSSLSPSLIGEKTANCILSRIKDHHLSKREIVFEPALTLKDSVKPILF
ncbi:LacI family DNA-binding transcriptional regulator [Hungatella sp.]|uniref:LacI family DNA-binding transcriptional regulator n=1 Tax=Hungatella sp. TaxID=2613924 RepID=UPI002A814B1F|nr:LacI family DNA-binding transcriptional regulator [Hungatella sp.]